MHASACIPADAGTTAAAAQKGHYPKLPAEYLLKFETVGNGICPGGCRNQQLLQKCTQIGVWLFPTYATQSEQPQNKYTVFSSLSLVFTYT